jgi:hypothetical protein
MNPSVMRFEGAGVPSAAPTTLGRTIIGASAAAAADRRKRRREGLREVIARQLSNRRSQMSKKK